MEKIKPTVNLSECNGNAFSVLGKVIKALRDNGYSKEEIDQYKEEATGGDYQDFILTTFSWVNVE